MNRWDGYENTVGFQDDVKKLQKMLFRTDHQQQIFISILGDSGVGKRTVVHNIFCNKKVIDHFKIRVSYRMLPDSTTEDLLQKIYDEAHKERPQHQTDKDIAITDKLQLLLAERRYLVVISGLSSKTMLNRVRASLPDKNNGSRVVLILDIESEEVAWHANTMNKEGIKGVHLLSRLDEKRSGQLFCSRAFRKELSYEKENMNQYNKIVYDITGGYPLAIVVLAGLLRFKEKPGQWEAVLQQLRPGPRMEEEQVGAGNKIIEAVLSKEKRTEWQMISATPAANTSTKRTIERVFWASFEDLPNDLKSCFLYLAAYPKNVVLHANITVFMWIAEGFIKPQKGKIMEETGHNYIKELVLRCLLQVEEMNAAGDITKVSVHKSLHGFLHSEAREAGFIEVHDIHDAFMPPSVRRLSYQSLDGRFPIFTNKFPKLHSFICYVEYKYRTGVRENHSHDLKFLCWSNFMRLISIRGLRLDRFPDEIGDMFHLRYLRVDCKNLKKLPSSIRRLLNLQTLDIRNTQIENIDPYFWQIKVLRHVLADNLTLPSWSIKEELDELQTLHGVKPAEEGEWDQLNCPLHKMTRLRSLELHGLKRNKHKAALESALTNMHLLGNLKVKGDRIPSCVLIGQHLQNLQILVLDGIVKWPEVGWGVRKVRPNLVELTVVKHSSEEVPKHIKDELQDMLKETIAM